MLNKNNIMHNKPIIIIVLNNCENLLIDGYSNNSYHLLYSCPLQQIELISIPLLIQITFVYENILISMVELHIIIISACPEIAGSR